MQNSGAAAGDGKAFKNGERVCQNSVSGRRSFKSRKAVREVFIDSSSVFSFASSIFGAVVVPVSVPVALNLVLCLVCSFRIFPYWLVLLPIHPTFQKRNCSSICMFSLA